ncbi:hypothetical protein ACLB1T_20760 [Escherichia coli]
MGTGISNRIDMLSTGIQSPIGIKVSGTVLADIDAMAEQIEEVARTVPGVASALAERLEGGRYINVEINREKAGGGRYDGGGCAVVCDFCGGRGDGWRNGEGITRPLSN